MIPKWSGIRKNFTEYPTSHNCRICFINSVHNAKTECGLKCENFKAVITLLELKKKNTIMY